MNDSRRINDPRKATIMMVDDEPLNMDVVQIFLQDAGYEHFVLESESVKAMERIEEESPDVILLDLQMPVVSGFDILEALRGKEKYRHLPVIVLTSSTDAETKHKALELGATDFLAKPVDSSELALRLRNTLAAKSYQDQLAYYDGLTGLPNAELFADRTEQAIKTADREEHMVAVLNIRQNRVKTIRNALGQEAADQLLKHIAQRLELGIRNSDSLAQVDSGQQEQLARVSNDEFVLLLPFVRDVEETRVVANRILEEFLEPVHVGDHEFVIEINIGIALYPADGKNSADLVKNATVAATHALQDENTQCQFFFEDFNASSVKNLRTEGLLRRALEKNELELYYQPKVEIKGDMLYGAEALLRWNNSELGSVSPAEFIPIAEETGLIVPIGEWVLREACKQQKAWQDKGLGMLNIAINLSVKQFHGQHLIETVRNAISDSGIDPKYLTLELTETMLMENASESTELMHLLTKLGPKLSIDDFGTGYSSLSYLRQFPLDELKIDQSFVRELKEDSSDEAIVGAIIFLAQSLEMNVVAEGVETAAQLDILRSHNCGVYQGFLYSKPVPAAEFEAILRERPVGKPKPEPRVLTEAANDSKGLKDAG